jgi:hypothetical protein
VYYSGKIIVRHDEGRREEHAWGSMHRLLCAETTGDPSFTLAEVTQAPGRSRGPCTGHEAFHVLSGGGLLRLWPTHAPADHPLVVPLRPGSEYYVRGDVPRSVESGSGEPLFGIALFCHVDRPCHAHAMSHPPGQGNELHYHARDKWVEPLRQEFVEAMYLVRGPAAIASADPRNYTVSDYAIDEGSAVYHPLGTLHRQYHPGIGGQANLWIHAGYYSGEGRPTAGVFDLPEVAFWQRDE